MKRRIRTVIVTIAVVAGAVTAAVAQWGALNSALGTAGKAALDTVTGTDTTSRSAGSPVAWTVLATTAFLDGGVKLLDATGKSNESAKCKALKDNITKNGPNRENLGEVNEVAGEMQQVTDKQAVMDKADTHMMTQAAVMMGAATYFETKVVNSSRAAVANGDAAHMVEMAAVGLMAPSNLQSMMTVQSAMFSYLKTKGIDPTAQVTTEVAKMEKG